MTIVSSALKPVRNGKNMVTTYLTQLLCACLDAQEDPVPTTGWILPRVVSVSLDNLVANFPLRHLSFGLIPSPPTRKGVACRRLRISQVIGD